MSNAALMHMLDRWIESQDPDPDASFLTRFLSRRDEDAFAVLVARHGPLVHGTCLRILGNRADADDAFQAVFFVLARRAHALKPERSIGPWLHGVALRVARKLRGQLVKRRLREMSAARSERVEAADPQHDFWAVIDEELARLPLPLREVLLLCDLSGQSHAQAARALGLAKGTVTKRLAKAHDELAARLKRRGVALGAGALAATIAARAPAAPPTSLLLETARQAVAFSLGQVAGSVTAKALAEGVMRSLKVGAIKVWLGAGLLGLALLAGGLMLAGAPGDPGEKKGEKPGAKAGAKPDAAQAATMWKENFTIHYPDSLPVSVAISPDGKTLVAGDTSGEVMAFTFKGGGEPGHPWKAQAGGSHAAVAFSVDGKKVYATTEHGACVLTADRGNHEGRVEEKDSNPTAIGVFPDKPIDATNFQSQIVFGNGRSYFVKTWARGNRLSTAGTIETSLMPKGAKPADVAAVPLAVDPKGRSAIMTGLRDGTGQLTGMKGKNVLWAYVCGDYSKDSPGNRLLVGHAATVVSAAWAKEGSMAVTGDAAGRAIVWDARTMKELRRVEFGGRIMALALSDDGKDVAAYVRGKRGGDVYVWQTAKATRPTQPIHSRPADLGGEPCACLTFSPDGKRLAGCAIDKKWLRLAPSARPSGEVRVWELGPEPKAQPAPRHLFTKQLPKGSFPSFYIPHNESIFLASAKEGAIDFCRLSDGVPQGRFLMGKFALGRMKLSSDRKWQAKEHHPAGTNPSARAADETFEVVVSEPIRVPKSTIASCSQLLDIASGGKAVAVVRKKKIELWDAVASKLLKTAPFEHARIDAACFSPDGRLLALAHGKELVLWRWEEGTHERIAVGRRLGSLTVSPDGKFLAEGPAPGDNIQIRDLETRKVVRTLSNGTKQPMSVPRMVFTQGGRVLIACDNIPAAKDGAVPYRILFWDTSDGSIAHRIALPDGKPVGLEVSLHGRYLAAMLDDGASGIKLGVWRLDGEKPPTDDPVPAPAAARP
jgi:RNA polymerase sigma factor (sigma-70 family)